MKRWQQVLLGIATAGLILFGIGFALPSTAHVERGIIIDAPPEDVYPLISDFSQWGQWSPWASIDPDAQMTITGSGLGQTMVWASENPQVGQGQQEIIDLKRDRYLKTHLEFEGQGVADAAFALTPTVTDTDGVITNSTEVVWSLDSSISEEAPFIFKPLNNYLGLLLDSLVGKDYETGLANLKRVVEG